MPELPEVEAARKLVETHCKGRVIETAICDDDDKVIEDIDPQELAKLLEGKTIHDVCRKGKQMWLDLGADNSALLLHFGMTGRIVVKGVDAVKYVNAKDVDPDQWPPRFWKIDLQLSGGRRVAFCDSRRFARAKVQKDPLHNEPVSLLGFDVLADRPTIEELQAGLAKRKAAIKSILLDQSFTAGVGNWVADEVLHTARIHPAERGCDLSKEQVKALQSALVEVAQTAVAVDADDSRYPSTWIFHHRWSEKNAHKGIKFMKIGGRTTAYEAALQKLQTAPAKEAELADNEEKRSKAAKGTAETKAKRPAKKNTKGTDEPAAAKAVAADDDGAAASPKAAAPAGKGKGKTQSKASKKAVPGTEAIPDGDAGKMPSSKPKAARKRKQPANDSTGDAIYAEQKPTAKPTAARKRGARDKA